MNFFASDTPWLTSCRFGFIRNTAGWGAAVNAGVSVERADFMRWLLVRKFGYALACIQL